MAQRQFFQGMDFTDVDRAITFLTAVGFTEVMVVRDQADPSVVHHAEYLWRDTGAIMFGSAGRRTADSPFIESVGCSQAYCVVAEETDVDRVHEAALAAGATSLQAPRAEEHGGRGCTVKDAEGNQWSFGTYAGG